MFSLYPNCPLNLDLFNTKLFFHFHKSSQLQRLGEYICNLVSCLIELDDKFSILN